MAMDLVDLERALAELADSLEFPGEADLAARVVEEIEQPAPVTPLMQRAAVRRVLALAAAAIVIVGVVLVASPRARKAVADLLGIGGVAIRTSDTSLSPAVPPSTVGTTVAPSVSSFPSSPPTPPPGSISVEDGASALGLEPPLPPALGAPRITTLQDGRLSLEWAPSDTLPPTSLPDVGALLTVFEGRVEEPLFQKILEPGTTYERTSVNGHPAVWLGGEPHLFLYVGDTGQIDEETLRLAGNTLIWTVGPHTYRLESALESDEAIALAETVPTA